MPNLSKNHHTPSPPDSTAEEFDEYYRELFQNQDGTVSERKTVDDWLDEYWCEIQLAKYKQLRSDRKNKA